MWPVKNSHGPARTPCAYWISVPPIGVGAMNFTSTILVSILHVVAATERLARASRRADRSGIHCGSSFIDTRLGQPYGFSRVSPPLEAEFVAGEQPSQDLRWRASVLRRAGRSRCRYLRRRVLLSARSFRLRQVDAPEHSRRVRSCNQPIGS